MDKTMDDKLIYTPPNYAKTKLTLLQIEMIFGGKVETLIVCTTQSKFNKCPQSFKPTNFIRIWMYYILFTYSILYSLRYFVVK